MSVPDALIIAAQTSPVAIQFSPTPGPVDQAPAAKADSAQAPPVSAHPSARNRWVRAGLGRKSRRARRSPTKFAARAADQPMTASGRNAPNGTRNTWAPSDTSAEFTNPMARAYAK